MSERTVDYWARKFNLYKKLHPEDFKDFGITYTPMRCDLCPYGKGKCPDPFLLLFPDSSIVEDTMDNFHKYSSFKEAWCIEWIKHV